MHSIVPAHPTKIDHIKEVGPQFPNIRTLKNRWTLDSAVGKQREHMLGQRKMWGWNDWIMCQVGSLFRAISTKKLGLMMEPKQTKSSYAERGNHGEGS